MNKLCALCIVTIAHLAGFSGFSQTAIPSYSLSITFQKTTNIIFPYRIQKADIGSADVIGHKDPALPNVLLLKANRKGFASTNLSVYTSDGKFYSFIVRYTEEPDTLNLSFANDAKTGPVIFDTVNEARLDSDAVIIQNANPITHRKTSSQQMKLILRGLYLKDHLMWFRLEIKNHSELDYQPEYFRFYVKERHAGKRTAVQETELYPAWRTPDEPIVGQGTRAFVFAFPVFTIDRHKHFVLQISEKNGGRLLILLIGNKTLLTAHKWKNDTI
jgi:conjugative transposon TraN protein